MTAYILTPATDYINRTVNGNLDLAATASMHVRSLTSGTYSISSDLVLLCDASGGDVVLNLPAISVAPRRFYIIKKTNLTNNLIIFATAGNTINGAFSYSISNNLTIELINSGGNDWSIISNVVAVAPSDSGIATREFKIVNGVAQNPALSVTNTEVSIQGTSTGTLANGTLGQTKVILIAEITSPGSTYTLSVSVGVNVTNMVFDTAGQSIVLTFTAKGWMIMGGTGAVIN